ncbi:MAG: hypothetical protein AAB338_01535 [Patescibacteria group bacterium]
MAKNYRLFRLDVVCKTEGKTSHSERGYKYYEIPDRKSAPVVADVKNVVRTELLPHYEEIICYIREHKAASPAPHYGEGYVAWKSLTLQRASAPATTG